MADIFALRDAMHAAEAALAAGQAKLDQLQEELDNAVGELPPPAIAKLRQLVLAQASVVQRLRLASNAAEAAYAAAVQADPLHGLDTGLPLLLLPVRLEAAYLDRAGGGVDLAIRVYPDDIHVDSHDPALTPREFDAGQAYWQAAWGAGLNADRLSAAWSALLAVIKPNRAAWVVEALRPAVQRPAGETPVDQPQPTPPLPNVPIKSASFARAAQTRLLPAQWQFIGWRNGQVVFDVSGSTVPDSLDVSFAPPGASPPPGTPPDSPFSGSSAWLVDLDAAIAVGMAVRVPLPGPDLGLDQLIVLGVNTGLAADAAGARLETLLRAHQYTNGLDFLMPGTPTNNTADSRSGWRAAALPPTPSDVEAARANYQPASAQNAALAAAALGVDGRDVLALAPQAGRPWLESVRALHRQLWPALGARAVYLVTQRWEQPPGAANAGWHSHADPALTASLQAHTTDWVHSRGALPLLRLGRQPYGLIPCSSVADWALAAGEDTAQVLDWLRRLRPYWQAGLSTAPRIVPGQTSDPDLATLDILSRTPLSRSLRLRADGDPVTAIVANRPFPQALIPGLPMNSPLFFAATGDTTQALPVPLTSDAAGDVRVLADYVELLGASLAVLQGADWNAWFGRYQSSFGAASFADAPPPDLFTSLLSDSFTDPLASSDDQVVTGLLCLTLFAKQKAGDADFKAKVAQFMPKFIAVVDTLRALLALATHDPAGFTALLPEVLDVYAHRYDAWVTSLAARRLAQMRAARPQGLFVGGYGWIENLERAPLQPVPPGRGADGAFTAPGQVYVHAPSLQHAATAAVLRAGYDSHADADTLAVNLSSRRVRTADQLAEGLRQGQTLGALLGYRFERGLHESGRDVLIDTLRRRYPQPLDPSSGAGPNASASQEVLAARNVVDGLALLRQQADVRASFPQEPVVATLLQDLADAVDALGDLLLAEGVHHLVGGNALRAGAAIDALRGEALPDRFDVVRTPRRSRLLNWQLGALMPASFGPAGLGWNAAQPRALLDPRLEAWVARLLGPASLYRLRGQAVDAAGNVGTFELGTDQLGVCALDLVAATDLIPSRVQQQLEAATPGGRFTLAATPADDGTPGWAELAGLARRLAALLRRATPLDPSDLQGPDAPRANGLDSAELLARASTHLGDFGRALDDVSAASAAWRAADPAARDALLPALRAALWRVADHGPGAAAPGEAAAEALADFAEAVVGKLRPLADTALPAAPPVGAADDTRQGWARALQGVVAKVAGSGLPLMPTLTLDTASGAAQALTPACQPRGADAPAIATWLRRLARVHAGPAQLHDLLLAGGALAPLTNQPAMPWLATQLPLAANPLWAALPGRFADTGSARWAGVWSQPVAVNPAEPLCGLVFERWSETLPGGAVQLGPDEPPSETTGLAFSVDAPDACAPQALLLAVAPDAQRGWSLDVLHDVVAETLELAKLRSMDLGDLPRMGRILPVLHSSPNVDTMLAAAGAKP